MQVEIYDVFYIIILTVVAIGLPLIGIELYMFLKQLNSILKDIKVISENSAEVMNNPEATDKFAKDLAAYTANNVIETQTQNLVNMFAKGVSNVFTKRLGGDR